MHKLYTFSRWSRWLVLLAILFGVVAFLAPQSALAASCTSAQSGNWNDSATWSDCSGGTPTSSDDVDIADGHTVTVTATASARGLRIFSGGTLVLDGSLGSDLSITSYWYLIAGGAFTPNGNRVTFNGVSTQYIQGETVFDKLTIGMYTVIYDNVTVNDDLALDADVYSFAILTIGPTATTSGAGWFDGTVRREQTFNIGQTYTFVNANNQLTFTSGAPPTRVDLSSNGGTPLTFPNAVSRQYEITPTGGSGYHATLRLSYRDWELNSGDENNFELYRYNGSSWDNEGQSNRDATNNWVEQTDITEFSPWAISASAPPPTCYATTSGDWNDSAIWQNCNGSVPNATRNAVINSVVTVTTPGAALGVTVNDHLNLQSDLDVYGDFTGNSGAPYATAGTVTLKGTTPQAIYGNEFYNVTMQNAAGATFSGSVKNVLTLSAGTFHVYYLNLAQPIAGTPTLMETDSSSQLTISGTASGVNLPSSVSDLYYFTLDNPNGTTLQTPLTIHSYLVLQQGILDNTTQSLTLYDGTTIQRAAGSLAAAPSFSGSVNLYYFNPVPITAGYEMPTGSAVNNLATYDKTVTLNGNVTVESSLNLYADLETGPNILTQGPTSYAGGSADVVGTVRREGPFNLSQSYDFGRFNNTLTFTEGTPPNSIDVKLEKAAPVTFPGAVTRTYLITPTGGSGYKATVRLAYTDADLGVNAEDALVLYRYDTTPSPAHWQNMGFSTRDPGSNWVEQTDVSQFSPWAMGSAPTAATLTNFNAKLAPKKNSVRVKWETGNELNVVGFQVWRKVGKAKWKAQSDELISAKNVGNIQGASYAWDDNTVKPGKTYRYKVEIRLANGASEWSEVITLKTK